MTSQEWIIQYANLAPRALFGPYPDTGISVSSNTRSQQFCSVENKCQFPWTSVSAMCTELMKVSFSEVKNQGSAQKYCASTQFAMVAKGHPNGCRREERKALEFLYH